MYFLFLTIAYEGNAIKLSGRWNAKMRRSLFHIAFSRGRQVRSRASKARI